ncbi:MAG: GAF domain-containing protein, partial [Syntrophobacteraceae bacterium]|nr:GAF domain-containing protein [Syntrophobacteraceae bacterium]
GEAENVAVFFDRCRKKRAPFSHLENKNLHKDGREVILERSAVPILDADDQFRGYRGIDRDITQRKKAENEIRQRNRELESLAAIAHLASQSLDLDHLLDTVLPEIARALEVRPVLLFLSEGEPRMALRGSFPSPRDQNLTQDELQVGECLCGIAVAEGMNLFSENIAEDPRCTNDACRNAGLVSVAAIPLQSAQDKPGVLVVASSSPRDFRQNEYFLSTVANSVATAVENADLYQEIRAHAASLERRVAERTAELETANKELEAFSYTVSHDLRAPLRSIDGFSKALEEEYGHVLEDLGKDYLRRVRDATRRMSQLIDDLLKLSKLTRGELKRQLVDLSALARAVASDLTKSGRHRTVDFVVAEDMGAWGDPHLLQLVMENLIRNAWKFTALQPRARIEVGVVDLDGKKAYFVRDNGVGFNPAHAHRLFQPFQRLHAASEFPGSGIGLATVKRIVHRHGGRVWIEAKEGEGATVYFSL